MIFGANTSSSSHSDYRKNNFLILGEGPTFGFNWRSGSPGKKIDINFSKSETKYCLSLHCNSDNTNLFVNRKEIYTFKGNNKNVSISPHFYLGSICNKFDCVDSEKVSFKGNVYDFFSWL